MTVREVCIEAGFGSGTTMHRLFLKHLGITPAKYKENNRKQTV